MASRASRLICSIMFCCSFMTNSFCTACASSRDLTFFSRSERLQALVELRVLGDLRPARLGFGLEVLPTAAGIERQKRGPLLDLVGGDRLVVDQHDDGLLALGGLGRLLLGLGRCRLRRGLAGGFWAASRDGCDSPMPPHRQAGTPLRRRRCDGRRADAWWPSRVRRARIDANEFTAEPSSAISVIHRTTMALAWQTGLRALFGGWDGPGIAPAARPLPSMSAYSFGPWFWSPNKWFSWSVL